MRGIKWQKRGDYAGQLWLEEGIEDEEEDCGVENLSGHSFEYWKWQRRFFAAVGAGEGDKRAK